MMSKPKTSAMKGLRALYILPLVCGALACNAKTVFDDEDSEIPSSQQPSESIQFHTIDKKPTFNGGDAYEFSKWVKANLVYPAEAKAAGKQGKLILQFTEQENGKVADVKVLRGIDPALDAEAIRVLSSSPDWEPGEKDGKKVSVTYTFPVIFQQISPKEATE